MEGAALVVQRLAGVAGTLFARAQCACERDTFSIARYVVRYMSEILTEVLSGLRNDVAVELHDDPARCAASDGNIEVDDGSCRRHG